MELPAPRVATIEGDTDTASVRDGCLLATTSRKEGLVFVSRQKDLSDAKLRETDPVTALLNRSFPLLLSLRKLEGEGVICLWAGRKCRADQQWPDGWPADSS